MAKFFKILILIIILLAVGYGAYWFFDHQQGGNGDIFSGAGVSVGDLFPFGNGGSSGTTSGGATSNSPTNSTGTGSHAQSLVPTARLFKISNDPQAGAIAFTASGTPTVRFIDKATGNVFEGSLQVTGLKRISNTTIPKIYEAVWQKDAKAVVLRYLADDNETIKTTYGKLVANTFVATATTTTDINNPPQELKTTFLPDNITSIAVNGANGLAYVTKNQNGSVLSVKSSETTLEKAIFDSAIKDFAVSWLGQSAVGLLTKPNGNTAGSFYTLKASTGDVERTIGNILGLSTLASPDGKKILYSESTGDSFALSLYDLKTGEKTAMPFQTLAEKCVWAEKSSLIYCAKPKTLSSGQYPDDWYKGKVSFSDEIWQVDTTTGTAERLIDPQASVKTEIDAVNLSLDPTENFLIFTNKKDSSLWSLRVDISS